MGIFRIILTRTAVKDLKEIRKSGMSTSINRINQIFKELETHPQTGTGKPERLKFKLSGLWSRRINQKDRLIYEIILHEEIVVIYSAKGHYPPNK